jgi:small subunit ribosomal protein S19e
MSKHIYSQEPQAYNQTLANALKQVPEMAAPEWVAFVKSSPAKIRVPYDEDFWYTRAASVLRQLYLKGVVGVGKLRTRYGGRKDRGSKPARFKKGSGKIIRSILQQAEAAGLVEKVENLQHGRRLTQKGRDFLDSISVKVEVKKEESKAEKPIKKEASETKSEETKSEKVVDGTKTQ